MKSMLSAHAVSMKGDRVNSAKGCSRVREVGAPMTVCWFAEINNVPYAAVGE